MNDGVNQYVYVDHSTFFIIYLSTLILHGQFGIGAQGAMIAIAMPSATPSRDPGLLLVRIKLSMGFGANSGGHLRKALPVGMPLLRSV